MRSLGRIEFLHLGLVFVTLQIFHFSAKHIPKERVGLTFFTFKQKNIMKIERFLQKYRLQPNKITLCGLKIKWTV